jgi:hypothetical protein
MNRQEVLEESQSTALTEQATAQSTTSFLASKVYMLREQEQQYNYLPRLCVYSPLQNRPHPLCKRQFCKTLVSSGYPLLHWANHRVSICTSSKLASLRSWGTLTCKAGLAQYCCNAWYKKVHYCKLPDPWAKVPLCVRVSSLPFPLF